MELDVLVVGGGIHGVGVLHDLASRGIRNVHLVEKGQLASGTSSRSTKLIHGGLRYLERFSQWGLVRESVRERSRLLQLLPGLVRPLPIVLPCVRGSLRPPFMVRGGLWLYDTFAGKSPLPHARTLHGEELMRLAPYLRPDLVAREFSKTFLYYDAQMQDDVVVRLVASAARRMGATFAENVEAEGVQKVEGGFRVLLRSATGVNEVRARVVINAGGAFSNANLLRWGMRPQRVCLLNLGSHLVLSPQVVNAQPNECAASLIQNADGRVVFFIPWYGQWLLGTTESILLGEPECVKAPDADRRYLLAAAENLLSLRSLETNVSEIFAGVRTMPLSNFGGDGIPSGLSPQWSEAPFASPFYVKSTSARLAALSRETVVDEVNDGLFSIYGGKFTTFRAQCAQVGDRVVRQLGVRAKSRNGLPEAWFLDKILEEEPEIFTSHSSVRHC